MPEGSPLAVWTRRQAVAVDARLAAAGHRVTVRHAMRYGNPSLPATLDALRAEGVTRVLVLPLYPQYAAATTASVADKVLQWVAAAQQLRAHWAAHGRGDKLVLSFHGVPERSLHLGDPYHCQCHKTARLLAAALGLQKDELVVTFQSRFGKAKWLEPYTEPTLQALAAAGTKRVDVMCPGFVADCLETLEEIAQEARHAFLEAGGEAFNYVPCLNDSPAWIDALAALAERHLSGWDTRTPPDPQELSAQRERALALGAPD